MPAGSSEGMDWLLAFPARQYVCEGSMDGFWVLLLAHTTADSRKGTAWILGFPPAHMAATGSEEIICCFLFSSWYTTAASPQEGKSCLVDSPPGPHCSLANF